MEERQHGEDPFLPLLQPGHRRQHLPHIGHDARRYGLAVGEVSRSAALRVYGDDAPFGLDGRARFEWDAVDAWYEEDEQVFVHPRDPYTRVDALRSTRHVRVELDGTLLARSGIPGDGLRDGAACPLLPQPQ